MSTCLFSKPPERPVDRDDARPAAADALRRALTPWLARATLASALASLALGACGSPASPLDARALAATHTKPRASKPKPASRSPRAGTSPAKAAGAATARAKLGGTSDAAAEPAPPPGRPVDVWDPSGRALQAFHAALRRAGTGAGQARVLFYGDSHVDADYFTGEVRRELQARYGDAGHGFMLPVRAWKNYRHDDVRLLSSGDWHTDRVGLRADRRDGWYGLAGASVSSSSPSAWGRLETADAEHAVGQRVGRFELFFLEQPGGGELSVEIDDREVGRVATAAEERTAGYALFSVPDGPHSLTVRPVGDGEVRLFGVAMERDVAGVVVDTVGITGARAASQLRWEPSLAAEHLARRAPDLVVIAYGTNESGDSSPIARYDAELRSVVARLRVAVPAASCLLMGPTARPLRGRSGRYVPRERLREINAIQREVAASYGCGFFDVVEFMGGPLSILDWQRHDPPYAARDAVHLSKRGYQHLGRTLTAALLPANARPDPTASGPRAAAAP